MDRPTRTTLALLALCLPTLAGCQKLKYEKTFTLSVGHVQAFPVDAPRREQKVTVTVAAKGSPVDVYVTAEADQNAVMDAITGDMKPEAGKLMASKEKVESDSLEVTVPAKTGFTVIVTGARKPTEVTLTITGK